MTADELRQFLQKQDGELKDAITKGDRELAARLLTVEQKLVSRGSGATGPFGGEKTIGELITEHEGFQQVQKGADQ
jgi:hypothetical protein